MHVYWRNSSCFLNKHKRTDYVAKVINHAEDDIIKIRIFYCHTCGVYCANGNLLPDFDLLRHLQKTVFFNMPSSYYEYSDMSPESLLRKNGYKASAGITAYERHRILDNIIDKGILTPYQIINHLGGLVDWHYWDSKWNGAVAKWREDILYVQNLDVVEHLQHIRYLSER